MDETTASVPEVSGWTVDGRHGTLGHVVSSQGDERLRDAHDLLVRGGTTHILYFHVPMTMVHRIAADSRVLEIDADISDFAAHLRPDGSIDLFPRLR